MRNLCCERIEAAFKLELIIKFTCKHMLPLAALLEVDHPQVLCRPLPPAKGAGASSCQSQRKLPHTFLAHSGTIHSVAVPLIASRSCPPQQIRSAIHLGAFCSIP